MSDARQKAKEVFDALDEAGFAVTLRTDVQDAFTVTGRPYNGQLTPNQLRNLAELSEQYGVVLRLDDRFDLDFF